MNHIKKYNSKTKLKNYKKKLKKKAKKNINKYNVYIFDLDDTLVMRKTNIGNKYYESLKKFLENLKKNGKQLYIATHNLRPHHTLINYDILDYFEKVIYEQKNVNPYTHGISDYTNKSEMIKEIIEYSNCKVNEMIFFDDSQYNIDQVSNIGVKSILVDPKYGINFNKYGGVIKK